MHSSARVRSEAAIARRRLLLASAASWAMIVSGSLWSPAGPVAIMCGARWVPGSLPEWVGLSLAGALLMIVAMMGPLHGPALAHIRASAFAHRRRRAVALYALAYVALWLSACLVVKLLALAVGRLLPDPALQGGAFALLALLALLWQISPLKQRCLNRCHRHRPLAAFGWKADRAALRFGAEQALWCIGSCWALMLLAGSLTAWHLAGMAMVALLVYCERLDPPARPCWRLRGCRTALLHMRLRVLVLVSPRTGAAPPWATTMQMGRTRETAQ